MGMIPNTAIRSLSESANWKTALFDSNLFLEYAAGQLLTEKGFSVVSDFKVASGESADFENTQVDVYAVGFSPFPTSENFTGRVELPVVCRQRGSSRSWVFMPDPNPRHNSRAFAGRSIRIVDNFSPFVVDMAASEIFDANIPVCLKGVEICDHAGTADTGVIRQDVERLRDSLPRILTDAIIGFLTGPVGNNVPFAFCPVLLTTVPLLVIDPDVRQEHIEQASDIREVARQVPYLMLYSDYSREFEAACTRECKRLDVLHKSGKTQSIEQKKARYYNDSPNLPYTITESLAAGEWRYLDAFFSRFIICDQNHFPQFIDEMIRMVESVMETRQLVE